VLQVVQYKQQSRLDEKRKKALDIHLSFIVDQTEKYSTWLTEGLTTATTVQSSSQPSERPSSTTDASSKPASPLPSVDEDGKFLIGCKFWLTVVNYYIYLTLNLICLNLCDGCSRISCIMSIHIPQTSCLAETSLQENQLSN